MVFFSLRLPPLAAGLFIAMLTMIVMSRRAATEREIGASADAPTLAQQRADAFTTLLERGGGTPDTEVIVHVRSDGCTLDDGTPVTDSIVERLAPRSFIRALIHDAQGHPIDASHRRRHPSARQKRVVKERDRVCVDCGSHDLLEYDHNPAFEISGRTVTSELEVRCASCHRERHRKTAG